MAKVRLNRDGCIGCSACANICPGHWEMAGDGKTNLKDAKDVGDGWFELEIDETELGCNLQAADVCPVNVIEIER